MAPPSLVRSMVLDSDISKNVDISAFIDTYRDE